jgi:hypothetical protein
MKEIQRFKNPALETLIRHRNDLSFIDVVLCESDNINDNIQVRFFRIPHDEAEEFQRKEFNQMKASNLEVYNRWLKEEITRRLECQKSSV